MPRKKKRSQNAVEAQKFLKHRNTFYRHILIKGVLSHPEKKIQTPKKLSVNETYSLIERVYDFHSVRSYCVEFSFFNYDRSVERYSD